MKIIQSYSIIFKYIQYYSIVSLVRTTAPAGPGRPLRQARLSRTSHKPIEEKKNTRKTRVGRGDLRVFGALRLSLNPACTPAQKARLAARKISTRTENGPACVRTRLALYEK